MDLLLREEFLIHVLKALRVLTHCSERDLAIREATDGPRSRSAATSLNNLAEAVHAAGDEAGALTLYERAVDIWGAKGEALELATALQNLACCALDSGDHARAAALGWIRCLQHEAIAARSHADKRREEVRAAE